MSVELSSDEMQLYNLLMSYRKSKGLKKIAISPALTYVAQTHARDMYHYYREVPRGCNMHSWSSHGAWSKCDYYPDHRNAEGMWNKPRELTDYCGNGYEIANSYEPPTSGVLSPKQALEGWKSSPGHNAVMVNINSWKSVSWNAVGIGMYKGCACIWFGEERDTHKYVHKNKSNYNDVSEHVHIECPMTNKSCSSFLIPHESYIVDYNSTWFIPNWVAYVLTKAHTYGEFKRLNTFSPDPQVADPVLHEDYTNNPGKYDRGHMAPAADMKWSSQAMSESFYTTNICPQNNNLNRGDWNDIEELVRDYARKYDSIYVVTGPIVESDHLTIGRFHDIAVPASFFKAIARRSGNQWYALGFICPNVAGSKPIMSYTVSIDEIERRTGHDLFYSLPDEIEDMMEKNVQLEYWSLSR